MPEEHRGTKKEIDRMISFLHIFAWHEMAPAPRYEIERDPIKNELVMRVQRDVTAFTNED